MPQAQRTVIFGSAAGLHARLAATIARAAAESGHTVTLETADDRTVNAASVLLLLTLGVRAGNVLRLTVTGETADATADALARLIASELDVD